MEHAKHIIRAALLLVIFTVLFVFARHFAIPASFGKYGHYRYDNVAEHAALAPVHGGRGSCNECHEEQAKLHDGDKHKGLSCEGCHDPLSYHVENGEKIADMPVRRSTQLCGLCHEYLVARPADHPQIDLKEHVKENGAEWAEAVCLECHNAHAPNE